MSASIRVFGVGESNSAICGLIISKMAADGHLGMMALSRITIASAGLSCFPGRRVRLCFYGVGAPANRRGVFGLGDGRPP